MNDLVGYEKEYIILKFFFPLLEKINTNIFFK